MAESMKGLHRTHRCMEVTEECIGRFEGPLRDFADYI